MLSSLGGGGPLSPTAAAAPLSPDGETAPDIYRKQVARIEELERENRKLGKDATDAERRWQKAEEQLSDLREGEDDAEGGKGGAAEKLVSRVDRRRPRSGSIQEYWPGETPSAVN